MKQPCLIYLHGISLVGRGRLHRNRFGTQEMKQPCLLYLHVTTLVVLQRQQRQLSVDCVRDTNANANQRQPTLFFSPTPPALGRSHPH